jgi:hypothetical protein
LVLRRRYQYWQKLHNKLQNLHSLANTILVSKSINIKWAEYVVHSGRMRNAYKMWSETIKRRHHMEGLDTYGRTILG